MAAEASLHSSLVHSSLGPDEHWLLWSSQLGGKWNGEHGLVAAAESLSFKDMSGQCSGDGARSTGVASSIAGWVLPMLNRSCDALAMKEGRACVGSSTESHAASLRRVTSVTWDPMGIRSRIGKPPRPGGTHRPKLKGHLLRSKGSLFIQRRTRRCLAGWLAGPDQPVRQAEWLAAATRPANEERSPCWPGFSSCGTGRKGDFPPSTAQLGAN